MATSNALTPGSVITCKSEEEYYEILELAGDRLVIVDCYAVWCPPCVAIAPRFEALSRQYQDVVFIKVDVDKVPSIPQILGVWAMPTFFFLKNGSKVGRITGANESAIRSGLESGGRVGEFYTLFIVCIPSQWILTIIYFCLIDRCMQQLYYILNPLM